MGNLLVLAAGCALLAVASGATTILLRPDSRTDAAVTAGVVAAAGAALAVLLPGAVGALTRGPVLALHAAWAAGTVLLLRRTGWRPCRRERPALLAHVRRHPWETAVTAAAAGALAWQLLVALVLPPFAFDAITYHLTIVATWIQGQDLAPTPLSLCCARYPANAELLFTWPVLLLGSDAVVDTVQVAFVLLAAAAVAGIARSAGLPRAAAAAAAGLFAMTPVVLAQAPTNFADVIVAACALAALHALVRFAVTGEPRRLAVAGLATGLVLGTKGTGIIWGGALAVCAVGLVGAMRHRGVVDGRRTAGALLGFAGAAAALGTYWYARNWIATGNPVYPFRVQAGGTTLFDGPFTVESVLTRPPGPGRPWPVEVVRSWAADLAFWRQRYDYQQRSGGLGPLWPWLALPLLVPFALRLVRRCDPAALVLAVVGLVLLLQPYRWWSRFTLTLAAVGAIAVVAVAVWTARPALRRGIRAAALGLALAGVVLASYEVDPAGGGRPLPARELLGLVGSSGEERGLGRLFFPEYRFLERVPIEATVVVDLQARPVRFVAPLFGPRITRRVLPAGARVVPGAWAVTAAGRPLDRALRGDRRFRLMDEVRGVRVYAPGP